MDKEKKIIGKIAEIANVDINDVSIDFLLGDNVLDSLGVLALSAYIDEIYDVVVPVVKIRQAVTVRDILALIEEELDG